MGFSCIVMLETTLFSCIRMSESSANDSASVLFRRPSSLYQSSVVCPTLAYQQLASSCSGLDALSFDLH